MVYFIDNAAPAVTAIRENLAALAIRSGFEIESCSVSWACASLLNRPCRTEERCTISYLDPPYAATDDYSHTLTSIANTRTSADTNGIVIAEHARKMKPPLAEATAHCSATVFSSKATQH